MTPFIIYTLGRSRTAWLSEFLSYGDWRCYHEIAIQMRRFDEVVEFFRTPRVGVAESAAAPAWRLIQYHCPGIKSVVIRRPVEDVVDSMVNADVGGVATYDQDALRAVVTRCSRDLDHIAVLPGVLALEYADLEREDACKAIFEHCLPYSFDRDWWDRLRVRNIQVEMKHVVEYYWANRDGIEGFKRACKAELIRLARSGAVRS